MLNEINEDRNGPINKMQGDNEWCTLVADMGSVIFTKSAVLIVYTDNRFVI